MFFYVVYIFNFLSYLFPYFWTEKNIYCDKGQDVVHSIKNSLWSVSDPFHFDMDPDPRIRFVE